MRIHLLVLFLLTISFKSFSQSDSTQNKSGFRRWMDRRNERLERAAEADRFEYQNNKRLREERREEKAGVNMQNDIDRSKTNAVKIHNAGYALKSGGGLLIGGLVVGIGGAVAGSVMQSEYNMKSGAAVALVGGAAGLLMTIIGGGQIIKAGKILTEY